MTYYDITIGNEVVCCDIIIGHDVGMGIYHDVTMHTDVARTFIYYAFNTMHNYNISVFLLNSKIFKTVH